MGTNRRVCREPGRTLLEAVRGRGCVWGGGEGRIVGAGLPSRRGGVSAVDRACSIKNFLPLDKCGAEEGEQVSKAWHWGA